MLISATRERILKLYFDDPTREIHLREISRQAKVVPQNVNLYLKEFVREGLMLRREISNMTFFKINPDNDYLIKIFEIFEINRREDFLSNNKKISRIINEYSTNLVRLSNREIQMIILFGSAARGRWAKGSDIDILTVTATKENKRKIIQLHEELKNKSAHIIEFSSINATIDKFKEGFKKKLEFYDELWRDRIVLYNELLFWHLIKEAKLKNG